MSRQGNNPKEDNPNREKGCRETQIRAEVRARQRPSDDLLLSGSVLKRSVQVRGLMNEPGAAESGPLLGGGRARP